MNRHRDYVELYKARDGYRWRYVAANGLTMADSGEAYRRRIDAATAATQVCDLPKFAERVGNWTRTRANAPACSSVGSYRWYR